MSQQSTVRSSCLSRQEGKVLQLVASGLSNKEIAARMVISPSTVKRHVENILRKLHVKNRVEAAVYAVMEGNYALTGAAKERSMRGGQVK